MQAPVPSKSVDAEPGPDFPVFQPHGTPPDAAPPPLPPNPSALSTSPAFSCNGGNARALTGPEGCSLSSTFSVSTNRGTFLWTQPSASALQHRPWHGQKDTQSHPMSFCEGATFGAPGVLGVPDVIRDSRIFKFPQAIPGSRGVYISRLVEIQVRSISGLQGFFNSGLLATPDAFPGSRRV